MENYDEHRGYSRRAKRGWFDYDRDFGRDRDEPRRAEGERALFAWLVA